MRLITGDECGLLKECIPELSRRPADPDAPLKPYNSMPDVVTKVGVCRIDPKEQQTRERGVVDMSWITEGDNFSFAALRKNGSVEIWTAQADKVNQHGRYVFEQSSKNIFHQQDRPSPLGLGVFQQQDRICAGDAMGNIVVMKRTDVLLEEVQTHNAYSTCKRGDTISYTPGKVVNTQLATAIAFDCHHGRVALGGRERETCLLDIATGKQIFKTKNLPPDPQTLLQQPVWPTAIQFLNPNGNIMAVGTAYKQVRFYDVRDCSKMRRPTQTTPEGLLEYRVTSLCQVDDYELVVGDAAGYIYSLDIRRLGRNLKAAANKDMGRYVGPAGSVRQLKKHPSLPRMAAVGLDRMLRVYDTKKRRQLDCIYLKQRLNCLLIHGDETWDVADSGVDIVDPNDVDIDQDDIVKEYVDSDDDDASEDVSDGDLDESECSDDDEESSRHENEMDSAGGIEDNDDKVDESQEIDNRGSPQQQGIDNDVKSDNSSEEDSEESSEESEDDDDEEEEEDGDEEDEDEVIVVKAPKRRRHR